MCRKHSQIMCNPCFKLPIASNFPFHDSLFYALEPHSLQVWPVTCELVKFRTSGSSPNFLNQNLHVDKMPGFTCILLGKVPGSLQHPSPITLWWPLPLSLPCSLLAITASLRFLKHAEPISTSGSWSRPFFHLGRSSVTHLSGAISAFPATFREASPTPLPHTWVAVPLFPSFPFPTA